MSNYFYTAYVDNDLITVGNTHHEVRDRIERYLDYNPLTRKDQIKVERQPFAIHPRWFDAGYFARKAQEGLNQ